jgi:hypothetical protein
VGMEGFEAAESLVIQSQEVGEICTCVVINDDHEVLAALDGYGLHRSAEVDMDKLEWCRGLVGGRGVVLSCLFAQLAAVTCGELLQFDFQGIGDNVLKCRPSQVSKSLVESLD